MRLDLDKAPASDLPADVIAAVQKAVPVPTDRPPLWQAIWKLGQHLRDTYLCDLFGLEEYREQFSSAVAYWHSLLPETIRESNGFALEDCEDCLFAKYPSITYSASQGLRWTGLSRPQITIS